MLALIALVIFFVIGIVLYTTNHRASARATATAAAPATVVAVVTETVTVVIPDGASIRVVGGIGELLFRHRAAPTWPRAPPRRWPR